MSIIIRNDTAQKIKVDRGVFEPPEMPELSNPAVAEDIHLGKEAINDKGEVITGTYEPYIFPALNKPASAEEILLGREAINEKGEVIVGTLEMPEDGGENKLALILGTQDVNNPYTITQGDVGATTKIPRYFFYQKTGLVSVDIESVTAIEQYAFNGCNNLSEVNLPNVENIGDYCFQNCSTIKHFNFSKATSIGQQAFANCAELETLDISNAKSIGSYACNSCIYLTDVKMEKAQTIDSYAFQHCYRIGYITIPATCTRIANNVFTNVGRATESGKATYRFLGDNPPTIYANTFKKDNIDKIIVNKGCGETYRTATNWVNFADYIEEKAE